MGEIESRAHYMSLRRVSGLTNEFKAHIDLVRCAAVQDIAMRIHDCVVTPSSPCVGRVVVLFCTSLPYQHHCTCSLPFPLSTLPSPSRGSFFGSWSAL